MHPPAPVTVAIGRSQWLAAWLGVSWIVGFLLFIAWLSLASGQTPWRAAATGLSSLAAACLLLWHWRSQPVGILQWDGKDWTWAQIGDTSHMPRQGSTSLVLDLQLAMLLRFSPLAGRPIWLWIERGMCRGGWSALRRATAWHVRRDALPGEPSGITQR
jgi:hypothetical protein